MYLYLFRELCLRVRMFLCVFILLLDFFYLYLMFLSFFFFNGQRFLMAEGVKTKTIIKLLFFISINGKKQ